MEKILMHYIQTLTAISYVNYGWPSKMSSSLEFFTFLGGLPKYLNSVDCLFSSTGKIKLTMM